MSSYGQFETYDIPPTGAFETLAAASTEARARATKDGFKWAVWVSSPILSKRNYYYLIREDEPNYNVYPKVHISDPSTF